MAAFPEQAKTLSDQPIGIDAAGVRREFDSMGDVHAPADRYRGAQAERSLHLFNIGSGYRNAAHIAEKAICRRYHAARGRTGFPQGGCRAFRQDRPAT